MTTDWNALAAHLPADRVPFGAGRAWLISTHVADHPDPPLDPDSEICEIQLARGTHGINLGRYSWTFDKAERLALAILAACKSGREWRARFEPEDAA